MVRLIKAIQSLFYLLLILMRSNTRGSKVNAIALIKVTLLARHQRQDGVERHGLLVLVEDLHSPFHHAGGFSSAVRCFFSVLRLQVRRT